MRNTHILIAEDDQHLRLGLIDLLNGEGYRVSAAADGAEALQLYRQEPPDLLLLDVMMPEKSGYDLCREIRREDPTIPIIMLTAKGEEIDKVLGLELGADDYITKPFGLHELRARIAAVLRRSQPQTDVSDRSVPEHFQIGAAQINRKTYQVELNGCSHNLTAREMKLLEQFFLYPDEVLSRDRLLNSAWGIEYLGTTRTLDQHIVQLRKKIEIDPAAPQVIVTVHGIGYRHARAAAHQP